MSTGQTTPEAEPVYGRMFQTPFSDQIRNEAKLATMCVGNITTADQVNTIIAAGRADLVALARPHLVDPFFTMKAAAWYAAAGLHCPPQYLAGKEQIFRNSRPRARRAHRACGGNRSPRRTPIPGNRRRSDPQAPSNFALTAAHHHADDIATINLDQAGEILVHVGAGQQLQASNFVFHPIAG